MQNSTFCKKSFLYTHTGALKHFLEAHWQSQQKSIIKKSVQRTTGWVVMSWISGPHCLICRGPPGACGLFITARVCTRWHPVKPSPHPRGETGQWRSSSECPQKSEADQDRVHCQASLLQMGLHLADYSPCGLCVWGSWERKDLMLRQHTLKIRQWEFWVLFFFLRVFFFSLYTVIFLFYINVYWLC